MTEDMSNHRLKDINELDTERLVQLQVEQMDKERRELTERMRIIAKRMDHIERAFRKEEVALLVGDYAQQQADDKAAFEATRQGTVEAARQVHQEKLATKRRLLEMMPDYRAYIANLTKQRKQDYEKRSREAASKIAEEKAKRREAVLKQREKESREQAEAERIRREKEAEAARIEQGTLSPFLFHAVVLIYISQSV